MDSEVCQVCSCVPAKYTCPGCSILSCSISCSKGHKIASGCTGIRSKVAYVPMNQYSYGTMMNDYVFLEDIGRKISDCGTDIARGGYASSQRQNPYKSKVAKGKRDILKMQLEVRGIEMDVLPSGMERHKINQSVWDFKKQAAFLTLELKFHCPANPLIPNSQPDPSYTILCHRNNARHSLLSILQSVVSERSKRKKDPCPTWVKSLIIPDEADPESFSLPHCMLSGELDTPSVKKRIRPKRGYFQLDPLQPLRTLLTQKHIVEFPTIDIWEEFKGRIVDSEGIVTQEAVEHDANRPTKRRRTNIKAMNSLLGDYGNDSGLEVDEPKNGLGLLGNYSSSDDGLPENEPPVQQQDDQHNSDPNSDEEEDVDPATLLRLLQDASHMDSWGVSTNKDDEVDWAISDEDS